MNQVGGLIHTHINEWFLQGKAQEFGDEASVHKKESDKQVSSIPSRDAVLTSREGGREERTESQTEEECTYLKPLRVQFTKEISLENQDRSARRQRGSVHRPCMCR